MQRNFTGTDIGTFIVRNFNGTDIGTFIVFPHLENWCRQNPNIVCKILNYFEDYLKKLPLDEIFPTDLVLLVSEYLYESHVAELCCYFAQAHNRSKCEFNTNVKSLTFTLFQHTDQNDDVLLFYSLLTESQADWNYVLQFNEDLDNESKFWRKWLKKMDYVFREIVWIH
jgi:hypothetical protein